MWQSALSTAPVTSGGLSSERIICLAHLPWRGPWKAYHQIMSRLAESNRILCVDPSPSLREAIASLRKREGRRPVLERLNPNLYLYNGVRLLARSRRSRPFNGIFERVRLAHVRRIAARLGFSLPILWVFEPMLASAAGTFGEKFLVYHVVDDYVEYLPSHAVRLRTALQQNERALLTRANVVFSVSPRLHEKCLQHNPNSFLVPNGVDIEAFQAAMADATVPLEVRRLSRPIIGYVGVIQPTFDFSLLRQLATRRLEWSFVLVGPEQLYRQRPMLIDLAGLPNVHYLGPKSVGEVPDYVKSCDVCIVPERERAGGDVIKIYEYLACGRPVVSIDASARRFQPLVQVASDAVEFELCIERSLREDLSLAEARIAFAQGQGWRDRVATISALVQRHLPESTQDAPAGHWSH